MSRLTVYFWNSLTRKKTASSTANLFPTQLQQQEFLKSGCSAPATLC